MTADEARKVVEEAKTRGWVSFRVEIPKPKQRASPKPYSNIVRKSIDAIGFFHPLRAGVLKDRRPKAVKNRASRMRQNIETPPRFSLMLPQRTADEKRAYGREYMRRARAIGLWK